MTISKPYLTFLASLALAAIGSIMAYLTDWIIIIPILFGLAVPIVNIEKPLRQKVGLIIVTVCFSSVIFMATVVAVISFNFDKYIFPGLLVGLSGIATLGINSFLIENIKFNIKSFTLTFLFSGFSLPIWILLTENFFPKTIMNVELIRQFGVMLFWMTLTTIGICLSMKTETNNQSN